IEADPTVHADFEVGILHPKLVHLFEDALVEGLALVADLRNSHALHEIYLFYVGLKELGRSVGIYGQPDLYDLFSVDISRTLFKDVMPSKRVDILDRLDMKDKSARTGWQPLVNVLLRL